MPEKSSGWIDDKTTVETETFDAIVICSFKETVADLTSEFGEDIELWHLGKIHILTIQHPLGAA